MSQQTNWSHEDLEFASNYVRNGIFCASEDVFVSEAEFESSTVRKNCAKKRVEKATSWEERRRKKALNDFAAHEEKIAKEEAKQVKPRIKPISKTVEQEQAILLKAKQERMSLKRAYVKARTAKALAYKPVNTHSARERINTYTVRRGCLCYDAAMKSKSLAQISHAMQVCIVFRWSHFQSALEKRYLELKKAV